MVAIQVLSSLVKCTWSGRSISDCRACTSGPPPKWYITLNLNENQVYQLNSTSISNNTMNVSSALMKLDSNTNTVQELHYAIQELCSSPEWAYARFELANYSTGNLVY